MRKEILDANPGAGSAVRRIRGLSREIGFALALTAAAAASLVAPADRSEPDTSAVVLGKVENPIHVSGQP